MVRLYTIDTALIIDSIHVISWETLRTATPRPSVLPLANNWRQWYLWKIQDCPNRRFTHYIKYSSQIIRRRSSPFLSVFQHVLWSIRLSVISSNLNKIPINTNSLVVSLHFHKIARMNVNIAFIRVLWLTASPFDSQRPIIADTGHRSAIGIIDQLPITLNQQPPYTSPTDHGVMALTGLKSRSCQEDYHIYT